MPGRGCVIVPATPADPYFRLRVGDAIRLRQPTGRVIDTYVKSLHAVPESSRMGFLLPQSLVTSDVPVHTEIWTGETSSTPPTIH